MKIPVMRNSIILLKMNFKTFLITYLCATFFFVIGFGGSLQGQDNPLPGNLLKSNWQQILGSGPHV